MFRLSLGIDATYIQQLINRFLDLIEITFYERALVHNPIQIPLCIFSNGPELKMPMVGEEIEALCEFDVDDEKVYHGVITSVPMLK